MSSSGGGSERELASPDQVDAIRLAMSKSAPDEEEEDKPEYDTEGLFDADFTPQKGKLKAALKEAFFSCNWKPLWQQQDKGSISNYITMLIMIIGIIGAQTHTDSIAWLSVQAIGLFGFSGGVTNWLAVKMLFDKVPGLVGSGIITQQFKEIRQTVMETVLETFFDSEFLGGYVKGKAEEFEKSDYLVGKIREVLQGEETDKLVQKHVEGIFAKPEGMMLMMAGIDAGALKPMVMPFVMGMDTEIGGMLTAGFDVNSMIDAKVMREQVQELMQTKMEMLTPEMVKELVEEMIRTHLGWLIVWGNLFGGLIGLVCQLASWKDY